VKKAGAIGGSGQFHTQNCPRQATFTQDDEKGMHLPDLRRGLSSPAGGLPAGSRWCGGNGDWRAAAHRARRVTQAAEQRNPPPYSLEFRFRAA